MSSSKVMIGAIAKTKNGFNLRSSESRGKIFNHIPGVLMHWGVAPAFPTTADVGPSLMRVSSRAHQRGEREPKKESNKHF